MKKLETSWKFSLGVTLRDRVTGFQGIVMARLEYLNGCIQYGIKPQKTDKKGAMPETFYIDQQQLIQVDEGISVEREVIPGCENHSDRPRQ